MSDCGCQGNCGCTRLSKVREQPVLLRNDDGNPCGSGDEPRRALLTARGNIRRSKRSPGGRRLMVAGLGEVPAVMGPNGRLCINGAGMHAE